MGVYKSKSARTLADDLMEMSDTRVPRYRWLCWMLALIAVLAGLVAMIWLIASLGAPVPSGANLDNPSSGICRSCKIIIEN